MIFFRLLLTCLAVGLSWAKTWQQIRSEVAECNNKFLQKKIQYSCEVANDAGLKLFEKSAKPTNPTIKITMKDSLVKRLGTKYQFSDDHGNFKDLEVKLILPTTAATNSKAEETTAIVERTDDNFAEPCNCAACSKLKKVDPNMSINQIVDSCIIPQLKGKDIQDLPQDSVLILGGYDTVVGEQIANDETYYMMSAGYKYRPHGRKIGYDFTEFTSIDQMTKDDQKRYLHQFDSIVFYHNAWTYTAVQGLNAIKHFLRHNGKIYIPNYIPHDKVPRGNNMSPQQYETLMQGFQVDIGINRLINPHAIKTINNQYFLSLKQIGIKDVPVKIHAVFAEGIEKHRMFQVLNYYVLQEIEENIVEY